VHKSIGMIFLLALLATGIAMVGCGSNNGSNSTNVNGNWSASLTNSQNGPPIYSFTTTLSEANGGGLSVTNFTFTSTSTGSCFVSGETSETGTFTLSGNFNGNVTGTFGMTVTSTTNSSTQLTLQGGVGPNNTVAGTWTLIGSSACSGQGNFTFTRM